MPLPYPTDPSTPSLPNPYFQDNGFVRGDQARSNNNQIWSDLTYLYDFIYNVYFGTGLDGPLTISSGLTTLTRDMYYTNLTINGTGSLNPNGYRIFVSGILDLTSAPAGAIIVNGNAGVSGPGGGAGGAGVQGKTVGGSTAGGNADDGTGTPGSGQNQAGANGGNAGSGGDNVAGSGPGGVGATGAKIPVYRFSADFLVSANGFYGITYNGASLIMGGLSGGAGKGAAGSFGGGAGSGAGILWIAARTISRGLSTATEAIRLIGGDGGDGSAGTGAGGGAGGGWAYIAYRFLTGASKSDAIFCKGGDGGDTTVPPSEGGDGGDGGRVTLINIDTEVAVETVGSAGAANSGITGGAGGTCSAAL